MLCAAAPTANADDLLVLDGEQVELSGGRDFGFVYVDGELRLTGDTAINAGSVYIGPNAWLRTCYVPAAGDTCTGGRSLTIRSAGPLTIEPSIDLTGRNGATRPGGSLVLSGTDIAVGGQITTAGNGGPSGSVSIEARGIATSGAITAYGAPVSLSAAGNLSVNGDIRTEGASQVPAPPGRLQGGAPVTISSSGGDVAVRGNVTTGGRDAGAGAGAGGHGADVSLSGGDVRVGNVDTTGGSSADADAGSAGATRLAARGTLHVLGRLDVSGAGSTNGAASGGGSITATAGGPAAIAGGAALGGANAPSGGTNGGRLEVEGASIAMGNVSAGGGNASASVTPRDGGTGGTIIVRSHGATSLGSLTVGGGSSPAGAHGGNAGGVIVSGQHIAVGQVGATGGSTGGGPGANGGTVSLDADGNLALGGSLNTSGSSANGSASPAWGGGSAGAVLLRAAEGTLDLGAPVWATGGRGSQDATTGAQGGAGGAGGQIDLVARTLGPVVSVVSDGGDGGDYGDEQGPGGAGGPIHGFTDGPLLDDLKVVQADGGDGNPLGSAGLRTVEASPASLAVAPDGTFSFASRSPGASRFRVLMTPAGGEQKVLAETTATTVAVAAALCVPVQLTVVAVFDGVRWTSNVPAAVGYTRVPKGKQKCGDAPGVRLAGKVQKLRLNARSLRRAGWRVKAAIQVAGAGRVEGTLYAGRGKKSRKLGVATAARQAAGRVTLRFKLPRSTRRPGTLRLRLVATAPDGHKRIAKTVPVEVRR